jgi:very-short-patch-repair endonuclease
VKPGTTQRYRQRRSLARSEVRIGKARELRRNQTESEEVAWRLLRTLRFNGFKFRRQHAVGRYIVDFCCPRRRLIVELDGSVLAQPGQTKRDASRDAELKLWDTP